MKDHPMALRHWLYLTVPVVVAGAWVFTAVHRHIDYESNPTVPPKHASAPIIAEREGVSDARYAERWKQWQQSLATPGHEAELAAEFEALVLADPARALALARLGKDPTQRNHLIEIVLLLWAETDSGTAAAEAGHLPPHERGVAVAAVLAGASKDVATTVQLAREFCRKDPELALEHGYALVNTLGRTGQFRAAIGFAAEASSGAESEDGSKWLRAAYAQWAVQDPAAALAAVNELAGSGHRFEALDAVAGSRVGIDPAGLAEALRRLPSAEDRNLVLGHALRTWVNNDVRTASQWLDQQEPSAEIDAGAAAVATATRDKMLNQRPEVALSWAESIVSPELRSQTLVAVVAKWAAQEPALARRYMETSSYLLPLERAELLASLSGNNAK